MKSLWQVGQGGWASPQAFYPSGSEEPTAQPGILMMRRRIAVPTMQRFSEKNSLHDKELCERRILWCGCSQPVDNSAKWKAGHRGATAGLSISAIGSPASHQKLRKCFTGRPTAGCRVGRGWQHSELTLADPFSRPGRLRAHSGRPSAESPPGRTASSASCLPSVWPTASASA